MAGGSVKSSVLGRRCRVVIRADWIAGTQSLPFKSALQHLRKPPAHLDKTAKGPLVTGGRGVDKYSDGGNSVAEARRYVDPLVDRACGIAAIDSDLRNQCMRERMREQVLRTKLIANGVIGNIFSPLTALLDPSISACSQRRDSTLHLRSRAPVLKRFSIQSQE
jgi:hypothetical protein